MILVIDNFDSFVFNLARYVRRLGFEVRTVRNDAITVDEILAAPPDAILLSPGPCAPDQAGICLELVRRAAETIPMLGVCLGHQTIAQAFGAAIVRSPEPLHGRSSRLRHHGRGLFAGLPDPLTVGRYHSLVAAPEPWPDDLLVTATTEAGLIMAFEHRRRPIVGFQFHPESILTSDGYRLLAAALRRMGLDAERLTDERCERLQRSEFGAGALASLDGIDDRPASVFGGSLREIGSPWIAAADAPSDAAGEIEQALSRDDRASRFPLPGAGGWD